MTQNYEPVARRQRRTLWLYRWEAWRDGVSVRDLWRIAKTYRRLMRAQPLGHNDGTGRENE